MQTVITFCQVHGYYLTCLHSKEQSKQHSLENFRCAVSASKTKCVAGLQGHMQF